MSDRRLIAVLVSATAALFVATTSSSSFAGELKWTLASSTGCLDRDYVASGQQLRLTGSGFAAGVPISLKFSCCQQEFDLPNATASGSGALDVVITVPTVPATFAVYPTVAELEARSNDPVHWLVGYAKVGPPGSPVDTDGDGIPSFCDNCPNRSNPLQENDDQDGFGDHCDACPSDPDNDVDGDGSCENLPPPLACARDPLNDVDNDDVCGDVDNCPTVANRDQSDSDVNGVGDACQSQATCADGLDNDRDDRIDFPADTGCSSATDTSETDPNAVCDDGKDNDADGLVDFNSNADLGDPGCGLWRAIAVSEETECDDGLDNDGDGARDFDGSNGQFPADPECSAFGFSTSEAVPEPGLATGISIAAFGLVAWRASLTRARADGSGTSGSGPIRTAE